ncbi:MAG: DUF5995 family protein, partial [Acidimicrobiales bacterium]
MIADVAARLAAQARASDDALGYFAAMYTRVTGHIGDGITAGSFRDAERMDLFATTFAGRYLDAMGSGPARPRCWQATIDVAGDRHLIILQHLLLGINAHVNHDLPLAVVTVAEATGDLQAVKPDFDAVNDLLGAMVSELLGDLDRVARWAN